jgi:hypothetical protein
MTGRTFWKEFKSLWPFGLVLLAGAALHYYPHHWWLGDLITRGLSEAVMIAALLGATVDKLAKKELMRELSVDLYFHYTGRSLPSQIKEYIKDALVKTALVATEHELRYSFELRTDGRLDVTIAMRRRIENFSPQKATIQHHTAVFLSEEPEYLEYSCEVDDSTKKSFSWPGENNRNARIVTERGARVFEAKDTILAPYGEPGSAATIRRRTKHVFRTEDTDINAHGIPTLGTTIIVDAKPEWLEFSVDQDATQLGSKWMLDDVLWARSFRRVRWFDKREKPTGPTAL